MPVARPRTVSLPKEQMIELGIEMVKWVKNNPQALHLNEFYTGVKKWTREEFKSLRVCPEFYPYYEEAMHFIAKKYIDGTVNPSISQRFLRLYFGDLRDEEDETAAYHAKLKANEVKEASDEVVKGFNALNAQLSEMQKDHIKDKILRNSSNSDSKS